MRRTGEVMNLAKEMHAFTAVTVSSLPPCGEELEKGVSPGFSARGLPPFLTLPRKGGGDAVVFAEGFSIQSGGVFA